MPERTAPAPNEDKQMTRSESIALGKSLKAAITTPGVHVSVSNGRVRYFFHSPAACKANPKGTGNSYHATEAEAAAAKTAETV